MLKAKQFVSWLCWTESVLLFFSLKYCEVTMEALELEAYSSSALKKCWVELLGVSVFSPFAVFLNCRLSFAPISRSIGIILTVNNLASLVGSRHFSLNTIVSNQNSSDRRQQVHPRGALIEKWNVLLDNKKKKNWQHIAFTTLSMFKAGVFIIVLFYLILFAEIHFIHCLLPVEL